MAAPSSNEILLGKHTRREFRLRMQSGEIKACIIPTAATEQHLEHLAMDHDWQSCNYTANAVARKLSPQVIVAPCMSIGISEHHMRHIGTLSAMPGSWLGVLYDTIHSMHSAGFENILVLNGHGGNVAPCEGIWPQFLQRLEINLQFKSYWEFLDPKVAESNLKTGRFPGHAQEFETAFALAAFPENVRHDAMLEQADTEPLEASAEAGHAMIESIVNNTSRFLASMIDGTNTIVVPKFH
ncbi:MAG: creatinine amidohydrolase [Candidatus Pelagisphaera sp.]|jgi:creatinine amidohydrolase